MEGRVDQQWEMKIEETSLLFDSLSADVSAAVEILSSFSANQRPISETV